MGSNIAIVRFGGQVGPDVPFNEADYKPIKMKVTYSSEMVLLRCGTEFRFANKGEMSKRHRQLFHQQIDRHRRRCAQCKDSGQ